MSSVASPGSSGRAFWGALAELVRTATITIDRPKGACHPRYPATVYPLDYGYLVGTTSGDGAGIDVWIGSTPSGDITGIVCTVDYELGNAEIKVLIGCTPDEMRTILDFHNQGNQRALLVHPDNKEGF